MRSRRRSVVMGLVAGAVIAAGALVAIAVVGGNDDTLSLDGPETSTPVPSGPAASTLSRRTLLTMDGGSTTLAALGGGPMVVNFWQSSCAPCLREMPDLERVHQELGTSVRFVGVNGGDEAAVAARYAAERGVTYEIVRDPRYDVATDMGVSVFPATFVVGADGAVAASHYGALEAEQLRSMIDEALAA